MRYRKNRRESNLAKVSLDKAEEDTSKTSGMFSMYSFFNSTERKEHKISLGPNKCWIYEVSEQPVPSKRYMYSIGKNGALYIGTPTVHSQFKAGKPVQSAGWIDYKIDPNTRASNVTIDNCSGHYSPSLSQFVSTLYGLHEVGILPDTFSIKINKLTKNDYQLTNNNFWENAIFCDSQSETSNLITVSYLPSIDGFNFHNNGDGSDCQLSRDIILQNSGKLSLA